MAGTLADLIPTQPVELRFKRLKSSQRLTGSFLMALRRASRTPESSRLYVKGDPVNLIDWKAYARTDQLIIREQRDEASARVVIGLEVTPTMRWAGPITSGVPLAAGNSTVVSKLDVGFRIAMNLAWLHLRQGDLVELWIADTESSPWFTRRVRLRSPADAMAIFQHRLDADLLEHIPHDPCSRRNSDVVYYVGDRLNQLAADRFLAIGKHAAHCHLLSSLEVDVSWVRSQSCYFDEGRVLREHQGEALKSGSSYQIALEKWCAKMRREVEQVGGHYFLLTDTTPIEEFHSFVCEVDLPNGKLNGGRP